MTISEFRENVQRVLAEGLGIRFVAGLLEGPNQSLEWLGSVYVRRIQEDPGRVAEQQIYLLIRIFRPFNGEGVLSPIEPYDTVELEEMAEKLMAVCAANQTGLGPWFQRMQSMEFDPATQGIQAQMMAYTANPSVAM